MLNNLLYTRLLSQLLVKSFHDTAPDIVGVGGPCAEVIGYVYVTLQLAEITVSHFLVVASNLPYPIIVSTDILRLDAVTVTLENKCFYQLNALAAEFASNCYSIWTASPVARLMPLRCRPCPDR